MSSSSLLHPPYSQPLADARSDTARSVPDAFAAPAAVPVPFVPPDIRLAAATALVDAPVSAPLVSGPRLETPMHTAAVEPVAEVLPSIDEFLLEAPVDGGAATMAALFSAPDADLEAAAEDAIREIPDASEVAESESWAIAEATETLAELADGLASRVSGADASPAAPEARVHDNVVEPLQPWTDDERWMDIMPTMQPPGGPDLAAETAWARAFAEPPAPLTPTPQPTGDTEAAAASLEAVARRLRAGDLALPGFHGDRGDAAALAAALAALLGARS